MKKLWSVSCLLAALCSPLAVCPSGAAAQAVFSGDGGFVLPVKAAYAASGGGFGVRLGRRIGIRNFWETPELVFNYATFASGDQNNYVQGFETIRGLVGVRLTLAGILRPGLFGHIGLGRVSGAIVSRGMNGVGDVLNITHTAATWDGGLTLDLSIARSFELGVHGSYNQILGPGTRVSFRWVEMGGHIAIIL